LNSALDRYTLVSLGEERGNFDNGGFGGRRSMSTFRGFWRVYIPPPTPHLLLVRRNTTGHVKGFRGACRSGGVMWRSSGGAHLRKLERLRVKG